MTIEVTQRKKIKIIELINKTMELSRPSIRLVACLLGNLVATSEGIAYAKLRYRALEIDKIFALKLSRGNYNAPMVIGKTAREDLNWWLQELQMLSMPIHKPDIEKVIYSDASLQGWGAHDGTISTGGRWTEYEGKHFDINVLELMAAKFALYSFFKTAQPKHVKIMIDNKTAVAYINHQGGTHSLDCNKVSREIWLWANSKNIWISAAYIPGVENTLADFRSRTFDDTTEWSIPDHLFVNITKMFGSPTVDMFASRINYKVSRYVSWQPDPNSWAIDAFSFNWPSQLIYCFPPFSVIWQMASKIQREKLEAIVIVPLWPTQSWFAYLLRMISDYPIIFSPNHLFLPHKPGVQHPLHEKLLLVVFHLSGEPYKTRTFLKNLKVSYNPRGDLPLGSVMKDTYENGKSFVLSGTVIPCIHL